MKTHLIAAALFGSIAFADGTGREIEPVFLGRRTKEEAMAIRESMDRYVLKDVRIENATFPSLLFYLGEKVRESEEYERTGRELSFSVAVSEKVIHPKDITVHAERIALPELMETICEQGDFHWSCGAEIMLISEKPGATGEPAAVHPEPVSGKPAVRTSGELQAPPPDAPGGTKVDGIVIGVWTEKPVYERGERRNVWLFARKDEDSKSTIGVGGTIYKKSNVHVLREGEEVLTIPMHGAVDGAVDPHRVAYGLSDQLSQISAGTYRILWKAESLQSNSVDVVFK